MSDKERARPAEGGSYVRKSGKLELVERTKPTSPAPPAKPAVAAAASSAPSPGVKEN